MLERSSLVRLQEEYDVEIHWRGFQLHPEIPRGGIEVAAMFGAARVASMHRHLIAFAAEHGVTIHPPAHAPWTIRPLAATERARDAGLLEPFRDRMMDAHWVDGRDIESDEVIAAVAREVGLDADEAVSAADDPAYVGRVRDMRRAAEDEMVTGIPTLFFGDYPVIGCQSWETFRRVADKLAVPRRPR